MFDLEKILEKGENDRIEFKRSLSEEKGIIETVGAFLNHKGGLIIIGYDEKKKEIIEPDIGPETIQKFINKVKSLTNPQVTIDIFESEFKGKKLLIINVIEYPIKLVAVQGKFLRRRMNSNHSLTAAEISNLHLFSLNSSWDYQLTQKSSVKEIDLELVDWFIKQLNKERNNKITEPPLKVLEKYELIRQNKPTFAALLLFPKNPSFILDVQIGLFEDEITIKKDKNIKKSVIFEIDEIMDFITAYITKEFVFTGKPKREERWQYPLEAIREIVINAVIHRDYQEGTHSQIKVFRDKISFWNSGKLPPDLSLEEIKAGVAQSKPRNRLLAQVFKDLGIIEKYGSGVKRVIEDFRTHDLEEPLFEEKHGGFYVEIQDRQFSYQKTNRTTQETVYSLTQETPELIREPFYSERLPYGNTTQENTKTTHETAKKILQIMQMNPGVTRRELAASIGISESGIKYHLDKLKKQGKILHIGPTKKGYWKIIG